MQTDVQGRVRNVSLPSSKPLLPLYEAVINSIEAIEDAKEPEGRIEVHILREGGHLLEQMDPSVGEIVGFRVEDNGIGFNQDNYDAFMTSDTRYKASRGGKGVGRFIWLVAFDRAEIESHFLENAEMRCRSFMFSLEGDGLSEESCDSSDETRRRTTVTLRGFNQKYRKQCPRKVETIAAYLIEHCLEYFIRPNCASILLNDQGETKPIDVNDMFERQMADKSQTVGFEVNGAGFSMAHVRLYTHHIVDHQVHYCAHGRVVASEKLAGRVPNLTRLLQDEDSQRFVYAAYVDSPILDTSVNSDRTAFSIAEDQRELLASEITWDKIREAVLAQCGSYLSPYTEPVRTKKELRIQGFVASEAPMYRPILRHIDKKIDMIDPEISDADLDLRLYEAYHEFQVSLKAEGESLLQRDLERGQDFEEYDAKVKEYFEKVIDVNAADLARYVCHRKAILEFLQKQLGVRGDGKYQVEERIHNIIFPMRATSSDVMPDGQNLWLIDEKLAYHKFLASDKPLKAAAPLVSDSRKEPDIIVFDKAWVLGPSTEPPFPAITIIEFKRPMRDDYDEGENPLSQVCDYIDEIRAGKALQPDGRPVPVTVRTPFYCYVVCDIRDSLKKNAQRFELMETPDSQGFFGFKRHHNAYFEVISYDKLISDAKKRNAVLFDKLGLSSRISG